jgi:hypothetical protein
VAQRTRALTTSYSHSLWLHILSVTELLAGYPNIPCDLQCGLSGRISVITQTFTPLNSVSITEHTKVFASIVKLEIAWGRYLSPYSKTEIEGAIDPFLVFESPVQELVKDRILD